MTRFDPTAEFDAIREGVARVCAAFPGAYWRDLDSRRAYPTDFVNALIREGYLADLLLIDGDPLTDITVLQDKSRILSVMKDGKFHREPPSLSSRGQTGRPAIPTRWAA
jgi:hypothetical protein